MISISRKIIPEGDLFPLSDTVFPREVFSLDMDGKHQNPASQTAQS